MSEREDVLLLAERLLDEPYADPDDDLRTLSRQLLRREERLVELREQRRFVKMSVEERAKRLVGDMPWVTIRLSSSVIEDLRKQIATSMEAAVETALIEVGNAT